MFSSARCDVYEACRAGERDRAVQLMKNIVHPLIVATSSMPTAAALMCLLRMAGHDVGAPLLALPELTADEQLSREECHRRVTDRV